MVYALRRSVRLSVLNHGVMIYSSCRKMLSEAPIDLLFKVTINSATLRDGRFINERARQAGPFSVKARRPGRSVLS